MDRGGREEKEEERKIGLIELAHPPAGGGENGQFHCPPICANSFLLFHLCRFIVCGSSVKKEATEICIRIGSLIDQLAGTAEKVQMDVWDIIKFVLDMNYLLNDHFKRAQEKIYNLKEEVGNN
jgi:hypothetical protein